MAQHKLNPSDIKEYDNPQESSHQKQSILHNLFKIGKFNEERIQIDACLSISPKYLLPLLILGSTLPFNEHNLYLLAIQQLLYYSYIYYPLIILNKFLILVALVALYRQIFLLSSPVKKIVKMFRNKLRLFIEIDYHVSMLLLCLSILHNLLNALLSYALYNFSCIYLENYINKDDYFYCSSCKASFFGRLLMTVGYIMISLSHFGANKGLIEIFTLLFTVCMLVWYHYFGQRLYPHLLVKRGMTGFISLLITASLFVLEKKFVGGITQIGAFIIQSTLSFGVILFYLSQFSNETFNAAQQNTALLEIKDVLNHLFVNQSSLDQGIFILGKIQIHRDRCQNLHCELHSFDLFNQKISLYAQQWGIKNIIKSYFRCLYESKRFKQDQYRGLLDYLQYLFSQKSCNPFKMSFILSQINPTYLNFFDRALFYDLKSGIEQLFKNQMKELYDGKLHFEDIIDFDNNCVSLQQMIVYIVKSNMKIFQHLKQSEIDLNVLFQRIGTNLSVEKDLFKCWGKIRKSLQYNRSISVIYLYYKQLINNERIIKKDLLFLDPEKNAPDEQIRHFSPKTYDTSILFHKETIIFTCFLNENKLLFKDFNLNFQSILQYSKEELVSAQIDNIFTEQLAKVHQDSFQQWLHGNLQSTYSNAQFLIKDTECLTKNKCVVPVIKYFKVYLSSYSSLEFICLLNVNNKQINTAEDMDYLSATLSEPVLRLENEQNEFEKSFQYRILDIQLSNEHAIFIKDKQFQPNSESWDIFQFKAIIFVFCFLIASSLVVFHLITVEYSIILQEYTKQYITFMQCYRIPMVLGNNYLQSIMQVGNLSKIAAQITQLSNTFAALHSNPIVIETLYNPSINVLKNYSTYSTDYLIGNRSLQFDSIELFYMISSSIASLRAPVNKTSLDFLTFDQLVTPSYDDMINGTKHKFHDSFIDYISNIISTQLTIQVIQIILCIIFFTLMIFKIRLFVKKMNLISDTIVYFKNEDLEDIINYWKNTRLIFKELFCNLKNENADNVPDMRSTTRKKREQLAEQYMNRNNKHIRQSKHSKKFWTITVLELLIGTLLLMGCLSVTDFTRIDQFNYLIYFEEQGYLFLKYFPTATITGYGCLSKYRSVHFPNETAFDFSRFNPSLEAMEIVGKFSYIAQVQQNGSQYFQRQRNYFFGNPCTFNPNVISAIGVNRTTCETIIDGSFTRGLTSYMRVGSQRARDYMSGEIDMNSSQLGEFSTSVTVLSAYILDAITTWGTQFNSLLDKIIQKQTIFTIVNFAVLGAVVLIIFIILFIGFLERKYLFHRYMFMKLIPGYILKADKVARQNFINFNILE